MAKLAKLEISDGTTTINLLTGANQTGFSLREWEPVIIQPKGGGVFQDSPIAPGRRLVYAVDATAIEDMTVDVNDYDQDGLIAQAQDLMRLLLKARAYQSTEFQSDPVWIRARSNCETNDRYALIINWAIPQLSNPYAQPFVSATEIATMDEISVQLERGHWLANAPGEGECAQVSSQQQWSFQDEVNEVYNAAGTGITALFQAANGSVYAGNAGNILRSLDNGDTWAANSALPVGNIVQFCQLANGYILAADDDDASRQVIRTIDNGANWTAITLPGANGIVSIIQLSDGRVLALNSRGGVFYSDDNGATWGTLATVTLFSSNTIYLAPNGWVIMIGVHDIYLSKDSGATWDLVYGWTNHARQPITVDGDIIIAGVLGVFKSADNGETWQKIRITDTRYLVAAQDGSIYAANGSADLARSIDGGVNFEVIFTNDFTYSIVQLANGYILVGSSDDPPANDIIQQYITTEYTPGQEAACQDSYLANKHNISNLTHIKIDDGGVFSDIGLPMTLPVALLPATLAVDDAVYFGTNTALTLVDTGPFCSLIFDLSTPVVSLDAISLTIVWEYWSGAAWSTLTTRDNTKATATLHPFGQFGVSSVHWEIPSGWATTAVDGVTGYWVRARVTNLGSGTWSAPVQANRDVYSAVVPYVDAAESEVLGDIAAVARMKLFNQSDEDGPGGDAPNLYSNRLVMGLRSYDRGEMFQAYLNLVDEQNPFGVSVATGTNTSFADDVQTPTGRRAVYNPAGVESMATRITVSLPTSIAGDFYGIFHAFLRARRTAGSSTDLSIRLQIATGSGGITFTSLNKQLQTTTAFEVLDFGEIILPVSSTFKASDRADVTEIRVQASAESGTPDLYLYDLILIPVDEWAVDAPDFANESDSEVGRSGDIAKFLDVDSVTDPRIDIKSLVRTADGNELITSEYNPITNGPAILQDNARQRLWLFTMKTSATGTSYNWLAPPEIVHSIKVFHNDRYLGQRGAR